MACSLLDAGMEDTMIIHALLLVNLLAAPASDPLRATLENLLLDEYRTEASYSQVLRDLGEVRPFSNIVHAERVHAQMLEGLLRERGFALPARPETAPVHASSRAAACKAAVQAEERNAALYDDALKAELPDAVRGVLEHNRDASRLHHLAAFQRCSGLASAGAGQGCGHGCGQGRGCGRRP
jgi:hypothetical protein